MPMLPISHIQYTVCKYDWHLSQRHIKTIWNVVCDHDILNNDQEHKEKITLGKKIVCFYLWDTVFMSDHPYNIIQG